MHQHVQSAVLTPGRKDVRITGILHWPTLEDGRTTWTGLVNEDSPPQFFPFDRGIAFNELNVVNSEGEVITESNLVPSSYTALLVRNTILGKFSGEDQRVAYSLDGCFIVSMKNCSYPYCHFILTISC